MENCRIELCSDHPHFRAAREVVKRLREAGYQARIVGGAVRDMLLKRPLKDCDVCTDAKPDVIPKLFAHTYAVGAAFGVIVVTLDSINIEVATLREETGTSDGRYPEHLAYTSDFARDAARRDFTINALYADPEDGTVYDYYTGLEDLKKGLIRAVGRPADRFEEDYLRMLRAIRFAARLGFQIDPETGAAIRANAHKITALSVERIRQELTAMLLDPHRCTALDMLDGYGLLRPILPEVTEMKGVRQDPIHHPEGDVWVHTLKALSFAGENPSPQLVWSILLHDIGKSKTFSIGEDGLEHFYNHEAFSRTMSDAILHRFKFDNESCENITEAVGMHMRFATPDQMRRAKLRRIIHAPYFPVLQALIRADALGCHGDTSHCLALEKIVESFANEPVMPPPFVSGNDLIAAHITPSRRFGEILKELYNRQLDGELTTREAALAAMHEMIAHSGL